METKRRREEVFIVGSGPSLWGFDFSQLKNHNIIAVNYAVLNVPDVTYFLTADSGVIRKSANNNFWNINKDVIKVIIIGPTHRWYPVVRDLLCRFDRVITPKRFDGVIECIEVT